MPAVILPSSGHMTLEVLDALQQAMQRAAADYGNNQGGCPATNRCVYNYTTTDCQHDAHTAVASC